ncbi:MAG: hypothetical protein LBP40_08460 [Campylobacteraceae bacterium]|jgi:uncharacterized protein (UPF0210 family)|nr:hypothetical protein [Campylobacteraceae bacterium]
MSGNIVMFSALLAAMFLLVIFIIVRDRNVLSRLAILEKVIEDLNQENHKLNKVVKKQNLDMDGGIQKIVEDEVQNRVVPLKQSLQEVKKITEEFREQRNTGDYEKKVIDLYKDGKSESAIAQILGLTVSQVELILSLNDTQ